MQGYVQNNGYPIDLSIYQNALAQLLNNLQRQNQGQNMMQQNNNMMVPNQQQQNNYNNNVQFIGSFVNSFEEAKQFPVPLGGTVLLMDSNNCRIYTKQINNQGDPIYNVFRFESVDGIIGNQQQPQQDTQGENNNQQVNNNPNSLEQLMTQLVNTINQLKENQDTMNKRMGAGFDYVNKRLKQIDGIDDTLEGGHK